MTQRLDRLIFREVLGPWIFGVAIFTALIMAGSFLFKLTDYVVKGISFATIAELTVLLLPGIMAKTFPMAVLLGCLLSFGRLSSDSEIVAMRASGTSLWRIMLPVGVFGLGVSLLAFFFNEMVVPSAALRATAIQQQIVTQLDRSSSQPTSYPIFDNKSGRLVAQVMARNFSIAERSLTGVTITVFDEKQQPSFVMLAPKLVFELVDGKLDRENGWRLEGGSTVLSADGEQYLASSGDLWPREVPKLEASPDDMVALNLKDLDAFSMAAMREQIATARRNGVEPKQIANLEYGYWNKVTVPAAALIYALVGAPLGIRNHRTGAAAGFWLSVIIIFGYMMLANFMAITAQGGKIPAWMASFTPLVIGLVVAVVTIHRKNS